MRERGGGGVCQCSMSHEGEELVMRGGVGQYNILVIQIVNDMTSLPF